MVKKLRLPILTSMVGFFPRLSRELILSFKRLIAKARVCICALGILTTSCLNATIGTDVSLTHDFDFTEQLPKDNSKYYGTVGDCYSPNLSKTFQKVDSSSSSGSNISHWKISNLNDTASISGGDPSKITGFSFYIINDKESKLDIPASDIKVDADGTIHLVPSVDLDKITKFLSGGSIDVCLFLTGELSKDFPKIIHNDFSFHVEVNISKSP